MISLRLALGAWSGRATRVKEQPVVPPLDERQDRQSQTRLLEEAEEFREAPEAQMRGIPQSLQVIKPVACAHAHGMLDGPTVYTDGDV